jgi:hypothetical protein
VVPRKARRQVGGAHLLVCYPHIATREDAMIVDRYTRFVLTVIALALCVIAAQNFIGVSNAQFSAPQKVQICDTDQCLSLSPVRQKTSAGIRFLTWALPVFRESD